MNVFGRTRKTIERVIADIRRRRLHLPRLSTPAVTMIPKIDPTGYSRRGYVPLPVVVLPYSHQALDYLIEDELLALDDPKVPVDGDGVALWRKPGTGELHHHPVSIAQYALAALGGYSRTGERRYLDRTIANANALLLAADRIDDQLWFPYRFPYRYYDVTMPIPWWSGLAQGQALSLFVRLAAHDKTHNWNQEAAAVFASFRDGWRALGRPWVSTIDYRGLLWFEEYAADVEPLLVVNGHIYATFGIYDYATATGDEVALAMFDGAATTIREVFDEFREPNGISYYCARTNYCHRPEWQNANYHPLHIQQLRMLGEMTGDPYFTRAADLLQADGQAANRPRR